VISEPAFPPIPSAHLARSFLTNRSYPGLAQVQLALDPTQDVIVDTAFIAQTNCGFTLYAQCLERKLEMAIMVGYLPLVSVASLKARTPLVIVPGKIFIQRGGFFAVLFFRIIQMGYSGVDHNAPRFLFLAVRAGGSSQTEGADKRRKGDALQYQRDANDAECEKNNHIPLGERAAIGKYSRKGEGGGQGDDSSHARPPKDEDLAAPWRPLTLMEKPGPYQP